jgi:hypothetical protein
LTGAVAASARLARVREQVAAAAVEAGRSPDSVKIVAASKYANAAGVAALAAAGQMDFGENYVQPAIAKIERVRELGRGDLRWHLIGALQSNKAARAAATFDLIHTLASETALRAIEREVRGRDAPCRVLIQIRLGTDRAGVEPASAQGFLRTVVETGAVCVDGVMGLAPLGEDPRPHFARLRDVLDELRGLGLANAPLREMSAGMSEDYREAIAAGATLVRIGRALFGEAGRAGETQ